MEINKLRDLNSHGFQLLRTKDEPVFGFIQRAKCIAILCHTVACVVTTFIRLFALLSVTRMCAVSCTVIITFFNRGSLQIEVVSKLEQSIYANCTINVCNWLYFECLGMATDIHRNLHATNDRIVLRTLFEKNVYN